MFGLFNSIPMSPMKLSTGLVTLAFSFGSAIAIVQEWGQCGGASYAGDTSCTSSTVCTAVNSDYSQCQPLSTTDSPSTGFVTISGTNFMLDGSKYTVVGGNAYWVGLTNLTPTDMNTAFADIAKAGATTVRTWGFHDVTTPNGQYYQSWSGSTPTINTGPTGLQNFDNVVAAAKANGIRLIVALTNNWSDYGGMDVYVKQILGSADHDLFYTDESVIDAYKNYIETFVSRYVDEPTIMAWEVANEPRCTGTTHDTTGNCTTTTITNWVKEISAFIKSIDCDHLVAIGDEGFYNDPDSADEIYQGVEGVDFDANLAIDTIDFGTFHSYPDLWDKNGNETAWGKQWIADHITSQNRAGKPVILEEFGVTNNQSTTYTAWWNEIISSGLTGDLIWQYGFQLSSGDTEHDEYSIYPNSSVYPILISHASAMKSRTHKCEWTLYQISERVGFRCLQYSGGRCTSGTRY